MLDHYLSGDVAVLQGHYSLQTSNMNNMEHCVAQVATLQSSTTACLSTLSSQLEPRRYP